MYLGCARMTDKGRSFMQDRFVWSTHRNHTWNLLNLGLPCTHNRGYNFAYNIYSRAFVPVLITPSLAHEKLGRTRG